VPQGRLTNNANRAEVNEELGAISAVSRKASGLLAKKTGNDTLQKPLAISNRRNLESPQNPHQCWIAARWH
jgi:hypothetical protein